jgi:hypothetical protein
VQICIYKSREEKAVKRQEQKVQRKTPTRKERGCMQRQVLQQSVLPSPQHAHTYTHRRPLLRTLRAPFGYVRLRMLEWKKKNLAFAKKHWFSTTKITHDAPIRTNKEFIGTAIGALQTLYMANYTTRRRCIGPRKQDMLLKDRLPFHGTAPVFALFDISVSFFSFTASIKVGGSSFP